MSDREPIFEESRSVEDLQHLQLTVLMTEMVRSRGVMRVAKDLGVNYRTLSAALETGRLSRRMRGALEKALLEGAGSPAKEQLERNDLLTGRLERVEELAEASTRGLATVHGEVEDLRNEHGQALRSIEGKLAQGDGGKGTPESTSFVSPAQPPSPPRPPRPPRREFPELATLEPAADDEAVFGDAWPLIREWRELRESHPDRGKGLDWLREEERLMTVELALLDDHGLTLPPQDYPLTGLNRNNQTNWRRTTLAETRRALRRRERLRWPLRVLALALRLLHR